MPAPAPVHWVTAPHEPALIAVKSGVDSGAGAVLIGPAGVGKTTLLRRAAEQLGPDFPRVDWARATAARATIPLAAVEHLVDVAETGTTTAAVLRAAGGRLGDGRLLVVDDAHLLDALSAALLYQLVANRSVRLLMAASPDGVPVEVAALWEDGMLARIDLEPPGHDDARLMTQIHEFVDSLPAPPRQVLEFLSVCDPITIEDAAVLTSARAVEEAVSAGAVVIDDDGVRPAHPLFLDAARATMGGPDLRRLRTALVQQLSQTASAGVLARLRLAALALDSDRPLPVADLRSAAAEALRLGDLELSERLGRAALDREPNLTASVNLGYALAWQGRGREADAVLADLDPTGLTEDELMAWALPTAANQFWMLSEPERATAFLHSTRAKVSSPRACTTLDALSATFAMNAGNLGRAYQLAQQVLASPDADETAIGWAGSAAALTAARMGHLDEVDAFAERATSGQPGLLRFTSGFGRTTALLLAGEADRALALAHQLTDVAQRRQPGRAIGEVLIAEVLIARGEFPPAATLLRGAALALTTTGYSWGVLAWMLLAQALGRLGETIEAGKALSRAESRHGLKSMMFAPELATARAWTALARRDAHGAVAAIRDAVKAAERGGQNAVALRAAADAVPLGDPRAAETLARLTRQVDCAFGHRALNAASAR